jgi:hypothetical protein
MTSRERFHACMRYEPVDRVPNHEVGVWAQTRQRWKAEGLATEALHWDWFVGEPFWDFDPREYAPVRFDMIPGYERKVLSRDGDTEVVQHANGVVTRALVTGQAEGMRASMDQYLRFPVETPEDFAALKKRFVAAIPGRYPPYWREMRVPGWKEREHVLVMSPNCGTLGFYWRAREWMGTEGASYAWYDEPAMMHEMMEFIADFTIETAKPLLAEVTPDYVFLNEDMSMKTGPLLSPETYREFIFPHMKRLVAFFKDAGVPWFLVDTDGNPDLLLPMLLECGVDGFWPLERAAEVDPLALRKKYGRDLRLWGGVDKRVLATTPRAIDEHLNELRPLVEEGGFIPTVDHLVPPDVSLENFRHYIGRKQQLLRGEGF